MRLYTHALEDRTLQSPNRADIYDKRGTAYYRNTDCSHAPADYSEAIKLSPRYSPCFHERGMAWQDKGDLAKANDDL